MPGLTRVWNLGQAAGVGGEGGCWEGLRLESENLKICGVKMSEICRGALAAVLLVFLVVKLLGVLAEQVTGNLSHSHCVAGMHLSFTGLWVGKTKAGHLCSA